MRPTDLITLATQNSERLQSVKMRVANVRQAMPTLENRMKEVTNTSTTQIDRTSHPLMRASCSGRCPLTANRVTSFCYPRFSSSLLPLSPHPSTLSLLRPRPCALRSFCTSYTGAEFKSEFRQDAQLFTASTISKSVQLVYFDCSPPPRLELLNSYRDDGQPCMKARARSRAAAAAPLSD